MDAAIDPPATLHVRRRRFSLACFITCDDGVGLMKDCVSSRSVVMSRTYVNGEPPSLAQPTPAPTHKSIASLFPT